MSDTNGKKPACGNCQHFEPSKNILSGGECYYEIPQASYGGAWGRPRVGVHDRPCGAHYEPTVEGKETLAKIVSEGALAVASLRDSGKVVVTGTPAGSVPKGKRGKV